MSAYESWHDFLRGRSVDRFIQNQRLCHVLGKTYEPIAPAGGFPWVTPVIGPGTMNNAHVAGSIGLAINAACAAIPDEDRRLVATFARSMVNERLGVEIDLKREVEVDGQEGYVRLGALLRAAMWLSKTYYAIQAQGAPVVGRTRPEVATLRRFAIGRQDAQYYLEKCEAAIKAASDIWADSSDGAAEAERVLAPARSQVVASGPVHIELNTVRALTEFCWAYLVNYEPHGWSDLLWTLFIKSNQFPPIHPGQGPRPVPSSDTRFLREFFSTLAPPAEAIGSPRLHDDVAEMLLTQARFRQLVPTSIRPPLATAFVTGFDQELEHALRRAKAAFIQAVPFEISDGSPGPGRIVWLGRLFYPDDSPEGPSRDRWSLLAGVTTSDRPRPEPTELPTQMSVQNPREVNYFPIVVRLSGFPLAEPPDLSQQPELSKAISKHLDLGLEQPEHRPASSNGVGDDRPAANISDDPATRTFRLRPALLVDEAVALKHAEESYIVGRTNEVGFPAQFSAPNRDHSFHRFWVLLGVQLSDPVIRHTLMLQLIRAQFIGTGQSKYGPTRGVAVNTRIDGAAEELLEQIGIDQVRGDVEGIGAEFTHYADHISNIVRLLEESLVSESDGSLRTNPMDLDPSDGDATDVRDDFATPCRFPQEGRSDCEIDNDRG